MQILFPSQSFQINSYFKLIKANKIKFKAITKPLLSDNTPIVEINSVINDTNNDLVTSKYFEPNEISLLIYKQTSSLSFFHLNISSLPHHFKKFSTILTENKLNFDFLEISESRIKLNRTPIISIQLPGYNLKYTPTESSNGGTLAYTKKTGKYKCRKDLQIYKPKELESTFIEINQKNKRLIKGLFTDIPQWISENLINFLPILFEKLSYGNKTTVCPGDFNANLLNYDIDTVISDFFNINIYKKTKLESIKLNK